MVDDSVWRAVRLVLLGLGPNLGPKGRGCQWMKRVSRRDLKAALQPCLFCITGTAKGLPARVGELGNDTLTGGGARTLIIIPERATF